MIEISICWSGELKSSEANIIKSFIINDLNSIRVFDKLMYRECSVIWFDNSVRDFWRWENRECSNNL